MTPAELTATYRAYLVCLDARDWDRLGEYVHEQVVHDDRPFGLAGYRRMLEDDVAAIPDLRWPAETVVAEPPRIAARIAFDCHPSGAWRGLRVDGRRVTFVEHVVYEYDGALIRRVWSVLSPPVLQD